MRALLSELNDHLLAALARLPDRDRDLIGLKFAAGLNNCHIAALTGLKEGNLDVIFFQAMQHLRAKLKEKKLDHD